MSSEVVRFTTFIPWTKPLVQNWKCIGMFEGDRDVTPEPPHAENRELCRRVNRENAAFAERHGFERWPFYYYVALTAEAIELEATGARANPAA